MFPVYICDDNIELLNYLKEHIDHLITEKYSGKMEIVCTTQYPDEVLDYLRHRIMPSIYFLDIDLGPEVMNGIQLGSKIRQMDVTGYIVIITTHDEMMPEVFREKIEALDFIEKDYPMPKQVRDCLEQIFEREKKREKQEIKTIMLHNENEIIVKKLDNIYAFEVVKNSHHLKVYEEEHSSIVTASLSNIQKYLTSNFVQCSKSVIVNLDYVATLKFNHVIMDNKLQLPLSVRKFKEIKKYYSNI